MTKRWWMPNLRTNLGAVRRAIRWLDAVTPAGDPAALVVASRTALFDSDLEEILGESVIKLLTSNRVHRLPSRGRLQPISMHGNHGGIRFPGVVLLVYPDKKHLDFVDQIEEVTEILVVPWEYQEVAFWVTQWRAAELGGTPANPAKVAGDLDPLVREAFGDLFSALISMEGKLRQKHKPLVIGLLDVLRDHGVNFTPEQLRIRTWVRRGRAGTRC